MLTVLFFYIPIHSGNTLVHFPIHFKYILHISFIFRIELYQWTTSVLDAGGASFGIKLRNNFSLYGRYYIFVLHRKTVFGSVKDTFEAGIQLYIRGNIAHRCQLYRTDFWFFHTFKYFFCSSRRISWYTRNASPSGFEGTLFLILLINLLILVYKIIHV